MEKITLTEAERQLLITLIELAEPAETPNNTHYTFYPKTADEAALYFLSLRVDTTAAAESLAARGLVLPGEPQPTLTEQGTSLARIERQTHPPIWYWYRQYFTAAPRSAAYSRFCTSLYGRDLCQTNFSDLAQVDFLIEKARLRAGDRVLDLGCGTGAFAEYLSACTGARVSGMDYTPEAIEAAQQRTSATRDRLDFRVGNFDVSGSADLFQYTTGCFHLITSIDTLYMPADLPATLRALAGLLAPGGRMLVFYTEMVFDPAAPRDALLPGGSGLARAAEAAGLCWRAWDFSAPTLQLMQRKRRLAEAMRADFEAEGTLFLLNHLLAESFSGDEPYHPSTTPLSRYLYEITVPAVEAADLP